VITSSSVNGNTWSNSAVTQSVTIFNGGSYNVSVSNGTCSSVSSNTIVTVNPLPTVSLNSLINFININANPISLNGFPTGGVYSGTGVTGNMFNPQIAGLGNSLITYSYTNSSGCIGSANQNTIVYDTTGVVCTTYDTITTNISVIDTLIINTTITGLTPPNNVTSIKVFPNPANDHITINYGNYAAIIGYTLKITNSLGQIVFTTPINQQTSYVDLSTWSGNGIYFLQIFDLQNNIIENRKIVLQ
jgi:hypothetical protein